MRRWRLKSRGNGASSCTLADHVSGGFEVSMIARCTVIRAHVIVLFPFFSLNNFMTFFFLLFYTPYVFHLSISSPPPFPVPSDFLKAKYMSFVEFFFFNFSGMSVLN